MADSQSGPFQATPAGLHAVALPRDVAMMLESEAKRHKKSVTQYLRDWLEDQADGREAAKRLKLIKQGKVTTMSAELVYTRLGI